MCCDKSGRRIRCQAPSRPRPVTRRVMPHEATAVGRRWGGLPRSIPSILVMATVLRDPTECAVALHLPGQPSPPIFSAETHAPGSTSSRKCYRRSRSAQPLLHMTTSHSSGGLPFDMYAGSFPSTGSGGRAFICHVGFGPKPRRRPGNQKACMSQMSQHVFQPQVGATLEQERTGSATSNTADFDVSPAEATQQPAICHRGGSKRVYHCLWNRFRRRASGVGPMPIQPRSRKCEHDFDVQHGTA